MINRGGVKGKRADILLINRICRSLKTKYFKRQIVQFFVGFYGKNSTNDIFDIHACMYCRKINLKKIMIIRKY